MKKRNIKLFTVLLAVVLIAGVSIFYACKKEETVKAVVEQGWQEKIEYMDIPCVDFSRIKKDVNLAKGAAPILVFESWEHYASVIEAMLEFSYNYIDMRVQHVRDSIPGIDDDDLSLILHNQGIYQFMPLYSFIQQLQFTNSAFTTLRPKEIQWEQDGITSDLANPFDEMELGYVQSALHNANGDVMIGNEIFNPKIEMAQGSGYSCRKNDEIDLKTVNNNVWPTYTYDKKTRQIRGFLKSYQTYSYAKTSMYYKNIFGDWIIWICYPEVSVMGKRLSYCDPASGAQCTFNGYKKLRVSVIEKYEWYLSAGQPNYLHPYYYIQNNKIYNAIVFGYYTATGAPKIWDLGL